MLGRDRRALRDSETYNTNWQILFAKATMCRSLPDFRATSSGCELCGSFQVKRVAVISPDLNRFLAWAYYSTTNVSINAD